MEFCHSSHSVNKFPERIITPINLPNNGAMKLFSFQAPVCCFWKRRVRSLSAFQTKKFPFFFAFVTFYCCSIASKEEIVSQQIMITIIIVIKLYQFERFNFENLLGCQKNNFFHFIIYWNRLCKVCMRVYVNYFLLSLKIYKLTCFHVSALKRKIEFQRQTKNNDQ